MKVLVVDDNHQNRLMLCQMLKRLGHEVIIAQDGREAVERYCGDAPDLVLMDVMMPVMNGFDATIAVRAIPAARWVPIVFLTALTDAENLLRGLEAGGDDYLTKPVNLSVLRAKISTIQRMVNLQRQLTDHTMKLEQHHADDVEEQRIGGHVMQRLIDHPGLKDAQVSFQLLPTREFSGDLVAAARTPDGVLHVMVADAAGHGLSAALTLIPLTQVFYAMTEGGYSLDTIVTELNRRLRSLMPIDRYVAAALASVDERESSIFVWNCGMPDVLFADHDGNVARRFESSHPPLGLVEPEFFDAAPEFFRWRSEGQLVLLSDGALEVENANGIPFGDSGISAALRAVPTEQRVAHLVSMLEQHCDGGELKDDVAVLAVRIPYKCDDKIPVSGVTAVVPRGDEAVRWCAELTLTVEELRYIDPLPVIFGVVERFGELRQHRNAVFLILAELFNNALDHGLLALNSGLKSEADGFERYAKARQKRLEVTSEGYVRLRMECIESDGRPMLKIIVADSGRGFDHARDVGADSANNGAYSGRGLTLVRNLCASLRFNECGSEVTAYYALVS